MSEPNLQSFLDAGTSFEGKIAFTGAVRIDGSFKGEAHAEGTLIVGESAVVEATLSVGSVVVHGKINGELTAADLVHLGPTARVEGTVRTQRLRVEEGAELRAKIEMSRASAPSAPGSPAPLDPKKS